MKYASQINIVIVVVALVTVGYAVSQTIWKSPVTVPVEVGGGGGPAGVASREGSEARMSSEAELPGRETLRRQSHSPRPPAAFQPNREPGGGSRANRQQKTTPSPRRVLPAGLFPGNSNPGPRVIATRPGFEPEGEDPIPERAGSERRGESVNSPTASRGSSPSRAPNRVGQRPAGRALPQGRADSPARGARRNTQPSPPPSRSSNR